MIIEVLLSIVFGGADLFLGLLPAFEWSADTGVWQFLYSFVCMIGYLLPWHHVIAIVSLLIALGGFRITMSTIRTIKSLIPFAG